MKTLDIKSTKKISAADYYGGNRDTVYHNMRNEMQLDWRYSGHYRYAGSVSETHVLNRYIKTTRTRNKQIVPDESLVVMLGGPFEEVGNTNETVGGENQKMG